MTVTQQADHVVDLAKVGVQPTPYIPAPEGAALGSSNAYMAVSPDVSGFGTSVIGTISSSFTPGESVNYSLNGGPPSTFAADVNGRLAVSITVSSGEGFIVAEAVGQSSGKHAGGVAYVSASAPLVRGAAIAPHAINQTGGTAQITLRGNQWPASTMIDLARNGTPIGTITSGTVPCTPTFGVTCLSANRAAVALSSNTVRVVIPAKPKK